MKYKFTIALLGFIFFAVFSGASFSQESCAGAKIFTAKSCAGDDLSAQEKDLYKIVNDYRAKNNLPRVALSNPLSIVANRHLLDLINNIKALSHGWSNCPYDIKNQGTWNCLFEAPKRLNVGYSGNGYENLYRNLSGAATPALALEAWKKSEMHNSLILNLNNWKDTKFDAFGIAISGNYAAVWFGSSGQFQSRANQKSAGLGITFDKAVAGLTNSISIKKTSSNLENEAWSGTSSDKSVMLSVVGLKEDISQADISIKIKVEKDSQISQKNRNILKTFLNNLAPEWKARDAWVEAAMKSLQQNPKQARTTNQGNKTVTVSIDKENYVSILVKPFKRPVAREIK
jgi:uncharacterized protein YkwD